MNPEEIQTFLTIVQTRSMSSAAKQLYIGQGTVSSRINSLEKKLKIRLFYRQPGVRELQLTEDGKQLLPLARQISILNEDIDQISTKPSFQKLNIVASNSLNTFLLNDFYLEFGTKHPDVFLTCQTEHATETHSLIETQKMDIGFSCVLHPFPNVVATPLFKEPLVIVYDQSAPFAKSNDLKDLPAEKEIYSRLGETFSQWHQSIFPNQKRNKIVIGTANMIFDFINSPLDWCILPLTIAKSFVKRNSNLCYQLAPYNCPERTTYLLLNKNPRYDRQQIIYTFINQFYDYLKSNEIELLPSVSYQRHE